MVVKIFQTIKKPAFAGTFLDLLDAVDRQPSLVAIS